MKRAPVIILTFLLVFFGVASLCPGGTVFLRGPTERGEVPLPAATSTDDPAGFGEFTVDIYAEDMRGFSGFQLLTTFLDDLLQDTPGFQVSYSTPNPLFGGRAIIHNEDIWPEVQSACVDETVGFVVDEEPCIPPCPYVMPWEPPWDEPVWLMSVKYWYTSEVPEGTYTISVDEENTVFGDTRTSPPVPISYTVVTGSVTISAQVPDTPPSPDPMTWAVEPNATSTVSISMTATSAAGFRGVEYYFEETSGNTGGSDGGWQDSPAYTDTDLTPGTTYTYRVKARDKSPNQNETGHSPALSETTPYPPSIASITPASGPPLAFVKIQGEDFGSAEGSVRFSGRTGAVISWSEAVIHCRVPQTAASGSVRVRTSLGDYSNTQNFTVTIPALIHVSNTGNVPGIENGTTSYPFSTIQRGIDSSSDGATVTVADGTYTGDGNRDIDFRGKDIHLRSESGPANCIIDCQGTPGDPHRGFYFHTGERGDSIVDGFQIINGYALDGGGGILCLSSPTVTNNIIADNEAVNGGGILCAGWSARITNNTIAGNEAVNGGGILCASSSSRITNNIVWANTGGQITASFPVVKYSDVEGGWPGEGNIDVDPLFADAGNGDYHLKSKHGRWDPTANGGDGGWVDDDVTSPCADAGNPASDFANEPDPNGGRINMGAYGNTAQASKKTAAKIVLVGPMDRGQGRLPPATSTDDLSGFGEFTVDIYAENMPGFAGFQLLTTFLDDLFQDTPGFWVSYSTPNSLFGGRAIVHNTMFLPQADHACDDQTVGLFSMEREFIPPFTWGDYIDKSIPPEGDLAAVNPAEMVLPGHEGLTWLMSVNYWYTSEVAGGNYTISVDEGQTIFGDARTDPPMETPYTVVTGSLAIGWPIPGDVTGDCVVNILDMIDMRNHFGQDVGSGDNWRYNLNGDGVINILDMLIIRDRLDETCGE